MWIEDDDANKGTDADAGADAQNKAGDGDAGADGGASQDGAQPKGDGKPAGDSGDGFLKRAGQSAAGEDEGRSAAGGDGADAGGDAGERKSADDADGDKPKLIFKERPDYIKPNYWNKDTGEVNVEALAKAEADLRRQVSSGKTKPPDDPDGYELAIEDEKLKRVEAEVLLDGEQANDPLVKSFKEFAHSKGMGQDLANELYGWFIGQAGNLLGDIETPDEMVARMTPAQKKQAAYWLGQTQRMEDLGIWKSERADQFRVMIGTPEYVDLMSEFVETNYSVPRIADLPPAEGSDGAETVEKIREEIGEISRRSRLPITDKEHLTEQKAQAAFAKANKKLEEALAGRATS